MIPHEDTENLSVKDYFWLIAVAFFAFNVLIWHCFTVYRDAPEFDPSHSRYHDANLDLETQPITTTQQYYERDKLSK